MNNEPLLNVKCFLLDMDGTFNLGNELIDGSLYFIVTLNELGKDYLFLTNNSSQHRRLYAEKITRLGLPISEEKVFTSGEATALYLQQEHPSSSIYLVGTPALEEEFRLELARRDIDSVTVLDEAVIITVVGVGMKYTPGLAGRIFTALGNASVNVIAIAQGSSEVSISLVVDAGQAEEAVRAIHALIVGKL